MNKLYTIGFTQKSAEVFFELLKKNNIETVIDIRLNNTSQLAGFAKFPDIQYFLNEICGIKYIHDKKFSPTEETLKRYKNKKIDWKKYTEEFNQTMKMRTIDKYIEETYSNYDNICLLCSEVSHENCHRSIISEKFKEQFNSISIINL